MSGEHFQLGPIAKEVLEVAEDSALLLNHSWISTPHLLYAFVAHQDIGAPLVRLGLTSPGTLKSTHRILGRPDKLIDPTKISLSPLTKGIVKQAIQFAKTHGRDVASAFDIARSMFSSEGEYKQVLADSHLNLDRLKETNVVSIMAALEMTALNNHQPVDIQTFDLSECLDFLNSTLTDPQLNQNLKTQTLSSLYRLSRSLGYQNQTKSP